MITKGMKYSAIVTMLSLLAACGGEKTVPEGAELVGSEGPIHFVYVDPSVVGDLIRQREIGLGICEFKNTVDYCEVYMWAERDKVLTSTPMHRQEGVQRAKYSIKNGRADLYALK